MLEMTDINTNKAPAAIELQALKNALTIAVDDYIKKNKNIWFKKTGLCRATNFLAELNAIDVNNQGVKKELLLLIYAVIVDYGNLGASEDFAHHIAKAVFPSVTAQKTKNKKQLTREFEIQYSETSGPFTSYFPITSTHTLVD